MALRALEAALVEARDGQDGRPALVIVSSTLSALGIAPSVIRPPSGKLVMVGRDAWLLRLRSVGRSDSALRAYRHAIDELLAWARRTGRNDDLFEEQTMVAHLEDYRQRKSPAAATYHRRFVLLRNFMRWLSRRHGLPDPFSELASPPKPHHEADWLTVEEFARMLQAAGNPPRHVAGLAHRDRLVLLTLVTTGLRRGELIALDWRDLDLDPPQPSLLVRHGKGDRARRQPLAPHLACELAALRQRAAPAAHTPVFRGLAGGRLQPAILADIVGRCARRAALEKHVTAHTLRHTAATWLRQGAADTRLVAEYLGHADLSTVSRYAHVAPHELHLAATELAGRAGIPSPL